MPASLTPPPSVPLSRILPNEPQLLMGAGPVPIPWPVARANGVVIDHLGETMGRVLQGIQAMARYAFQTETDKIIGVSGPSSGAMEMAISNLCWPGRRVLALVCGTFSRRLADMAVGVGADVTVLESPKAQPVTAELVAAALSAARAPFDVVTLVQGETSCGVLTVELPEIVRLAKDHGALVVVDSVCTLSTMPLQMDGWGIDVTITGGQKGVSSIPGVSPIAFSPAAWAAAERRPKPAPHWCYDAIRAWNFWGRHQYHYTAPVPGLLALYEALRLICEETLPARFARHRRCSAAMQAGLEAMGLELFVPEAYRLPSVLAITVPSGVDAGSVRHEMMHTFGVQISGAFGLPILRVGQMGEQCHPRHLFRTLYAMGESFRRRGYPLDVAAGMSATEQVLTRAGDPPA